MPGRQRETGGVGAQVGPHDGPGRLLLEPFPRVALGDPGCTRELIRRHRATVGQRAVETEPEAEMDRQDVEVAERRREDRLSEPVAVRSHVAHPPQSSGVTYAAVMPPSTIND